MTKRNKEPRETRMEETYRVFPVCSQILREMFGREESKPSADDAAALLAAWKDPDNKFEALASARSVLVANAPHIKSNEGKAVWGDYRQISLWGDAWKEIGTRSYLIELETGKHKQMCVMEMNKKQVEQAKESIKRQMGALDEHHRDLDRFWMRVSMYGCPDEQSPTEFFGRNPSGPEGGGSSLIDASSEALVDA